GRRLLPRGAAGRPNRQLHRLSRAQGGACLQRAVDARHPDVASAGALPRGQAVRRGMVAALLSGDLPRSRVLSVTLALILLLLAAAPFLFGGAQAINTAAKICVFIVLVASYDLLLGYCGIVSFAHSMFYGLGGYGVGLALYSWGATWGAALAG